MTVEDLSSLALTRQFHHYGFFLVAVKLLRQFGMFLAFDIIVVSSATGKTYLLSSIVKLRLVYKIVVAYLLILQVKEDRGMVETWGTSPLIVKLPEQLLGTRILVVRLKLFNSS